MKQTIYMLLLLPFLLWNCHPKQPPRVTAFTDSIPAIYPDYVSVTVPAQIAPLNFSLCSYREGYVTFSCGKDSFSVSTTSGFFDLPATEWKKLLASAAGNRVTVAICAKTAEGWKAFRRFVFTVSNDSIDPYVAYRRIAPGHQLWGEMGIYQRELASFRESTILENRLSDNNCMNCHAFCMNDPGKMLLHIRSKHGCTVLTDQEAIETLDTKTDGAVSALVYPYWHPSGEYIACSVNNTTQDLHATHRTEVYDKASDVVVYHVKKREIHTVAQLSSAGRLETFPAFSPDGRWLYFCSAPALPLPDSLRRLRYSLCRIAFNASDGTFGTTVDTLFDAGKEKKSFLFPRVSPDGRFMLGTLTDYGTFPIWHRDADLHMIDLRTGKPVACEEANSDDTESYHSWSANGKWVIFSSRRLDGLYTRLFISHVEESGKLSKPFLLPQATGSYYTELMQSYNVPEFIRGKVPVDPYTLSNRIKKGKNASVLLKKN